MKQYLDLLREVLARGCKKKDRTGTGTISSFGHQLRFDLRNGFPLMTTKKLYTPAIVHELLWFIKGDTNISYLKQHNVSIWDEWADENGDLGPIYGKQWRRYASKDGKEIDQLARAIEEIKHNRDSRRILVSSWNVGELEEMRLQPCHVLFQFYVAKDELSLQLYQRSADLFLGVPFNIASYALLLSMVAQVTGLRAAEFIHSFGDAHIYLNHIDQVRTQLSREPLPLAELKLNPEMKEIDAFTEKDIEFLHYQHHPAIKAEVSV